MAAAIHWINFGLVKLEILYFELRQNYSNASQTLDSKIVRLNLLHFGQKYWIDSAVLQKMIISLLLQIRSCYFVAEFLLQNYFKPVVTAVELVVDWIILILMEASWKCCWLCAVKVSWNLLLKHSLKAATINQIIFLMTILMVMKTIARQKHPNLQMELNLIQKNNQLQVEFTADY